MATPSWFVVGVLAVSAALTASLAAFGWRRRTETGVDWFVALMAVDTAWIAFALVETFALSPEAELSLEMATTVFAVSVPVLWFCFVVEYTGRGHLLGRRRLALIWAVPAGAFLSIIAHPVRPLYFADVALVRRNGAPAIDADPGPVAWLNLAYVTVLVIVGLWFVARMLWEHDRLYSGQAMGLLVGTLAPVALAVPAVFELTPAGLPVIAMGFSVLGAAYAYSLFHHRLLDFSPAPRRIGIPDAFDDLGEGVVIVDDDGDVVALNDRACELFDCEKDAVLGGPLAEVSTGLAESVCSDGTVDVRENGRIHAVSASTVLDARDRPTGRALVVRDVTAARRRKQRLAVLNRVFRHNIRNTMNAVVGPADVLANRLDGDDGDLAETALEAGETVVSLSETVRTVEEMMTRSVAPRSVDVSELVDDVVESASERNGGDPRRAESSTQGGESGREASAEPAGDLSDFREGGPTAGDTNWPTDHAASGTDPTSGDEAAYGEYAASGDGAASGTDPPSGEDPPSVETSVPAGLTLRTDPAILEVVLANVVENALEHGSTDGDSTGGSSDPARVDGGDPGVTVDVESHERGCLFRVTDDGPGIPEGELAVLRGGSETQLSHGSGLGLWAIHWGVTRLGGAVRFDRIDAGTRVSLWVPALGDEELSAGTVDDVDLGPGALEEAETDESVSPSEEAGETATGWFGSDVSPPVDENDGERTGERVDE